jgi:hypothetical protein
MNNAYDNQTKITLYLLLFRFQNVYLKHSPLPGRMHKMVHAGVDISVKSE